MNATDDKTVVREYFNATGFDRWKRIYGNGDVNKVQLDIRKGHQQTVDTLMEWLNEDGNLDGLTCCDAGCGVGSLAIPLAQAGAKVYASDISAKMVEEAKQRAEAALEGQNVPTFEVKDLEDFGGTLPHRNLPGRADPLPSGSGPVYDQASGLYGRVSPDLELCPQDPVLQPAEESRRVFFLAPVRRLGLTCTARLISSRRWRRAGLKSSAKR